MEKCDAKVPTEKAIREAERWLRKSDVVMKRLVADHGPCPLAEWEYWPFHTLVTSIISQQLSAKAADTIEQRVSEIVTVPFHPDGFLRTPEEALRGAELSRAKVRYIRELAQRLADGRVSFAKLEPLNDDAVIAALIDLPGVGRWTAEMFLIFGLKRLDVLSLGDAGLQRAARLLYDNTQDTTDLLERIGAVWRPYRSVASWYLWQHLGGTG